MRNDVWVGRYLSLLPENWSCFPGRPQGVPQGSSCQSFETSPELELSSMNGFLERHLVQTWDTPPLTLTMLSQRTTPSNNIQLTDCWRCQLPPVEGGCCLVPVPRPGWKTAAPRAETVMAFDSVWDIQHSRGQLSGRLVGEWREKRQCRIKVQEGRAAKAGRGRGM